jgi:hypothetical protein
MKIVGKIACFVQASPCRMAAVLRPGSTAQGENSENWRFLPDTNYAAEGL